MICDTQLGNHFHAVPAFYPQHMSSQISEGLGKHLRPASYFIRAGVYPLYSFRGLRVSLAETYQFFRLLLEALSFFIMPAGNILHNCRGLILRLRKMEHIETSFFVFRFQQAVKHPYVIPIFRRCVTGSNTCLQGQQSGAPQGILERHLTCIIRLCRRQAFVLPSAVSLKIQKSYPVIRLYQLTPDMFLYHKIGIEPVIFLPICRPVAEYFLKHPAQEPSFAAIYPLRVRQMLRRLKRKAYIVLFSRAEFPKCGNCRQNLRLIGFNIPGRLQQCPDSPISFHPILSPIPSLRHQLLNGFQRNKTVMLTLPQMLPFLLLPSVRLSCPSHSVHLILHFSDSYVIFSDIQNRAGEPGIQICSDQHRLKALDSVWYISMLFVQIVIHILLSPVHLLKQRFIPSGPLLMIHHHYPV